MKKVGLKNHEEITAISDDDENCWETIVDFTKYYKDGIPIEILLELLDKIPPTKTSA